MAKAVKKTRKSSSTAGKVLKAVAALLPHKKATKKAKANPKRKSASSKSKSAAAKNATTKRPSSGSKSKVNSGKKYADTLRAYAQKKQASTKTGNDPAHAPGHRKLRIAGLKKSGAENGQMARTVMNNNSKADRIHQTESAQRRLGRR